MYVELYYCSEDQVWAYVINQGRACWWASEIEEFERLEDIYQKIPGVEVEIMKVIDREGFDPATLPHIEDVDPLLKELWDNISISDNNMWFVEPEDIDEEIISREEYEGRIDAAIKEYHLENIIVKNEDGNLYTCYAGLQWRFSEKWQTLYIH